MSYTHIALVISYIASLFWSLIATFFVSRLLLLITAPIWQAGGIARLVVVHLCSWLVCVFSSLIPLLKSIVPPTPVSYWQSIGIVALAQAVWFLIDIFRLKRQPR
jgi:hypothetical protein